jgi:CRISPR-associated protein Csx17
VSEFHTHRLDGCAPIPLASYLKALGVLRLLASSNNNLKGEAADPTTRGWWEKERFWIRTRLDRDPLLRFFLDDYAPSPIIAPWNGRAGFLEGDAGSDSSRTGAQLMKAIEESGAKRLSNMRAVIAALRQEPMLVGYDKLRANAKAQAKRAERAAKLAKKAAEKKKLVLREKLLEAAERAQELKKGFTRQAEATKSTLLPSLRSNADARHLRFIDACFVLAQDEHAAPLLGSGGNDGSRDFGVNFAEALEALFDFDTGAPKALAGTELEVAILGIARPLDTRGSIGQFGPGQGGPNGSTGYEGWNPLNRWDVLLVLEGTLLFVGALTRRWGVAGSGRAAFPFTFEPSHAGSGALSTEDPNAPRGEIWTPLWGRPSSLIELEALLAEGRLTVGRATARTGLEAARAVARLGVSRGLAAFERYSLIQPDAKMPYQATPLGRFAAPRQPRNDPVADFDAGNWLARLRGALGKNAPARARIAARRLDDALFEIAREGSRPETLQGALIALGHVASWLATSQEGRKSVGVPPPRLGRQWMHGGDDSSSEFSIASALASLGWPEEPQRSERGEEGDDETAPDSVTEGVEDESLAAGDALRPATADASAVRQKAPPPMAAHFAPLAEGSIVRRFRQWADNDPAKGRREREPARRVQVWGAGSLIQNMIAVLERRLIEQSIRGLGDKPLGGLGAADLPAIAAFLEGPPAFDDARCAALLAGLVWAQPTRLPRRRNVDEASLPFAYAALKPLFTPDEHLRARPGSRADARRFLPEGSRLPIPAGLVARLRRGALDEAVRGALGRARASGFASPFNPVGAAARRIAFGRAVKPDRLAAALLIPIDEFALTGLINRAYPLDERQEETDAA